MSTTITGIVTWLKQWFYDKNEIDSYDTGWSNLTCVSGYASDTSHPLQIRRINKLVEIRGVVKPTASVTASSDVVQFATIPTGYRPSTEHRSSICQGSGINRFMLRADPNGVIGWTRYGTTSSVNLPNGAWMGIHITYMID